jgi:hypothetical protein
MYCGTEEEFYEEFYEGEECVPRYAWVDDDIDPITGVSEMGTANLSGVSASSLCNVDATSGYDASLFELDLEETPGPHGLRYATVSLCDLITVKVKGQNRGRKKRDKKKRKRRAAQEMKEMEERKISETVVSPALERAAVPVPGPDHTPASAPVYYLGSNFMYFFPRDIQMYILGHVDFSTEELLRFVIATPLMFKILEDREMLPSVQTMIDFWSTDETCISFIKKYKHSSKFMGEIVGTPIFHVFSYEVLSSKFTCSHSSECTDNNGWVFQTCRSFPSAAFSFVDLGDRTTAERHGISATPCTMCGSGRPIFRMVKKSIVTPECDLKQEYDDEYHCDGDSDMPPHVWEMIRRNSEDMKLERRHNHVSAVMVAVCMNCVQM